jgi:ribosomal protein S18 acetylase RimI-like enzyme
LGAGPSNQAAGRLTFSEPMTLIIRRAVIGDSTSIREIDTVVPIDKFRSGMIEKWLEKDIVLVAAIDNRIVGYGVFNHEFLHQSQVDMLMISKDYRHKEIGTQLLLSLEKYCDTPKMYVTTNLSNHPMQNLLIRNGYKSCGLINELDPGDPELVFVKFPKAKL